MWRRALALWMAAVPLCACTNIVPQLAAGSDFTVIVRAPRRVAAGVRLTLRSHFEDRAMEAVTDAQGIAPFRGVLPGAYSLDVGKEAHLAGVLVDERPVTQPPEQLAVDWYQPEPIMARALRGAIRVAETRPADERAMDAELQVYAGAHNRLLRTVRLAPGRRQFDLRGFPAGRYALVLREGSTKMRAVVEVDPQAKARQFDLLLGASICGGPWVHNRASCPQAPLPRLSRLAGVVVDTAGAPVPNATVWLSDATQAELMRLETDDEGRFVSPHPAGAGMLLSVYATGFTPVRVELGAKPQQRRGELTVALGVGGLCSETRMR